MSQEKNFTPQVSFVFSIASGSIQWLEQFNCESMSLASSTALRHCQKHNSCCVRAFSFRPESWAVAAYFSNIVLNDCVSTMVSNNIVCSFGQLLNSTTLHEFSGFFQHSFHGQSIWSTRMAKGLRDSQYPKTARTIKVHDIDTKQLVFLWLDRVPIEKSYTVKSSCFEKTGLKNHVQNLWRDVERGKILDLRSLVAVSCNWHVFH